VAFLIAGVDGLAGGRLVHLMGAEFEDGALTLTRYSADPVRDIGDGPSPKLGCVVDNPGYSSADTRA